jgi:hypothetical protein
MYVQYGLWIGLMMARWAETCCQICRLIIKYFCVLTKYIILFDICVEDIPRAWCTRWICVCTPCTLCMVLWHMVFTFACWQCCLSPCMSSRCTTASGLHIQIHVVSKQGTVTYWPHCVYFIHLLIKWYTLLHISHKAAALRGKNYYEVNKLGCMFSQHLFPNCL